MDATGRVPWMSRKEPEEPSAHYRFYDDALYKSTFYLLTYFGNCRAKFIQAGCPHVTLPSTVPINTAAMYRFLAFLFRFIIGQRQECRRKMCRLFCCCIFFCCFLLYSTTVNMANDGEYELNWPDIDHVAQQHVRTAVNTPSRSKHSHHPGLHEHHARPSNQTWYSLQIVWIYERQQMPSKRTDTTAYCFRMFTAKK